MILLAKILAIFVVLVMIGYMIRHFVFAMSRLFHHQRMNYTDLSGFHLPSISVLIPMHNEEAVAPDVIEALLEADYPHDPDLFEIIPINDHSEDRTGDILDEYAKKYPFIKPLHRTEGLRGKPAALKAATQIAQGDILIIFDADYIPGKSLLKFLSAPFADAEIGAVMGRVVPHNVGASLLTRLLDLERAGGYQINQQARYNLGLIPQFGGTVGSVRRTALEAVGGWNSLSLTEDTDLTLQLAIHGWKVAYVNRAECYEEVPVSWSVRRRQIERWAIGHTECFHRYLGQLLRSDFLDWRTKLDGAMMLGVYITAPLIVVGWIACTVLFFSGQSFLPALAAFFIGSTCYNAFGNFASFFEIGSSVILDGAQKRVRLLPLNIANFVFSTATVSTALGKYYTNRLRGREPGERWIKTQRFRGGSGNGGGMGLSEPGGGKAESDGVGSGGAGSDSGAGYRNAARITVLNLAGAQNGHASGNGISNGNGHAVLVAGNGSNAARGLNYLRATAQGNGNGPSNGHANGNGHSNGNGHTNGNGHSNGHSNGNGGNGHSVAEVKVNGNGHANGHSHGHRNGNGHASGANGNGHALVAANGNGSANGHAHGNGNGLNLRVEANGHTNGNGHSNGNGHNGHGTAAAEQHDDHAVAPSTKKDSFEE
jgi:cellulose synthase/poly-beta-1,6-N-acetylglucosamine synthase-like glycosyltransferase